MSVNICGEHFSTYDIGCMCLVLSLIAVPTLVIGALVIIYF